jgi:hypothetical protein
MLAAAALTVLTPIANREEWGYSKANCGQVNRDKVRRSAVNQP